MHVSIGHNMAEIIAPEVREDNNKKLILSWIGTCYGYLNGKSAVMES